MYKSSIHTILVDDEAHALDALENLLGFYPDIQIINKITDPAHAIRAIHAHQPDLLFLDIQMPGLDGFQLLEAINPLEADPSVIFTTSYDEYAIRAIRYAAFDYLLKPVEIRELANAIDRFKNNYRESSPAGKYASADYDCPPKIKFNTQAGTILLRPDEIVYIQAQGNYSRLCLNDQKHELVSMNIGKLEDQLSRPPFFRVSRSAIINSRYLQKIDHKNKQCHLVCDGNTYELSISKNRIRVLEQQV